MNPVEMRQRGYETGKRDYTKDRVQWLDRLSFDEVTKLMKKK